MIRGLATNCSFRERHPQSDQQMVVLRVRVSAPKCWTAKNCKTWKIAEHCWIVAVETLARWSGRGSLAKPTSRRPQPSSIQLGPGPWHGIFKRVELGRPAAIVRDCRHICAPGTPRLAWGWYRPLRGFAGGARPKPALWERAGPRYHEVALIGGAFFFAIAAAPATVNGSTLGLRPSVDGTGSRRCRIWRVRGNAGR